MLFFFGLFIFLIKWLLQLCSYDLKLKWKAFMMTTVMIGAFFYWCVTIRPVQIPEPDSSVLTRNSGGPRSNPSLVRHYFSHHFTTFNANGSQLHYFLKSWVSDLPHCIKITPLYIYVEQGNSETLDLWR